MSGGSYAEMLARSSTLRKPLHYTPATTAATVAAPARSMSSPRRRPPPPQPRTRATADSPRRLLSYYLSKAEYNARAGESDGDDTARDHVAQAAAWPSPSRSPLHLRPPPLLTTRTTASRPTTALTHPWQLAAADITSSDRSRVQAESAAHIQTPVNGTRAVGQTEAERHVSPPLSSRGTSPPSVQHEASHLATSPAMSAYTEEQRRVFEAQVMQQVEALLQAQRSESHAELESYRLAAAEAQATLQAVEAALGEKMGESHISTATYDIGGDAASALDTSTAAPRTLSPPAPPAASPIDELAEDMCRVAAVEASPAAETLLDAIMNIQTGEDVPAVLRQVVLQLYHGLTRALVSPVMDYVQRQQRRHPPAPSAADAAGPVRVAAGGGSGQDVVRDGAALLQAEAEVAALRDEVHALRRTLRSRDADLTHGGTGAMGHPRSSASAILAAPLLPHPSQEGLVSALHDRLFAECHAALARSRHEALTLRRTLEEERRQHFLTRLRLLQPAHALSRHGGSVAAPHTRAASAATDGHDGGVGGGSPSVAHASSATRSPAPSVHDVIDGSLRSGPHATAPHVRASSPPAAAPHPAPRRWTPAHTPLQLPSDVGDGGGGVGGDLAGDTKSPWPHHTPPSAAHAAQSAATSAAPRASAPPLPSAVRVAEEVLRVTASAARAGRDATHPYYGEQRRVGEARDEHEDREALPSRPGGGHQRYWSTAQERHASYLSAAEDAREGVHWPVDKGTAAADSMMRGVAPVSPSSIRVLGSSSVDSRDVRAPRGSREEQQVWDTAAEGHAGTAVSAPQPPPSGTHERRVWDKTIELLSRYSIS
ncbi:hypothetical protein NESM_000266600 [Novymonas esmeraldas]|uniref:Uncharacterized protein n=1 Tax=Novymonas esmeraldas TaxID=1808958 RepID=A0AAW0FAS2_9TRYP